MGEHVAFPFAVISIKFAEESPNHHTFNPIRTCSNVVEHISFCFSSFSEHRPSMAVQILHFIHPWTEHRDSGSVMTSTREISRLTEDRWTNPTSTPGALESKSLEESEGQIEDCKIGAGDWLVQNLELNKDSTSVNCQVHQREVQNNLQPTKMKRNCLILRYCYFAGWKRSKCSGGFHWQRREYMSNFAAHIMPNTLKLTRVELMKGLRVWRNIRGTGITMDEAKGLVSQIKASLTFRARMCAG